MLPPAPPLPPSQVAHPFAFPPEEPVFVGAGERVEYYGQPLGLIVAETRVRGFQGLSTFLPLVGVTRSG